MRHELLPRLACPACRRPLALQTWAGDAERTEAGYLQCPSCAIVTPIVDGLVLFTEPCLHAGQATPEALAALGIRLFGRAEDFDRLLAARRARTTVEVYAAFQPFNESMRAVEPLLPWLEPLLPAGAPIVDLWCRTGWSAEWLAGRFPASPVVALWEGAHSVLGYRGWRHLLGSGRRAPNLDVVFTDPRRPLPFADAAFAMVYSHDVLHRYGWQPLAGESLRVARADGAVVHSHLHLSNRQPEPFFERGCEQLHGRDYRAWLDALEAAAAAQGRPRLGRVLSEAALFDGPAVAALDDAADTAHYNGLLVVLPAAARPMPVLESTPGDPRWLLNPLLQLSLQRDEARVDPAGLGGGVAELLQRHPLYAARLPTRARALSATDWALIVLAATGAGTASLRAMFGAGCEIDEPLARLAEAEVLRPVPVGPAAFDLQQVHAGRLPVDPRPDAVQQRLDRLFRAWATQTDRVVLRLDDGDAVVGPDACGLVSALQAWVGTAPQACRAVLSGAHPLMGLVGLALAAAGVAVHFAEAHRDAEAGVLLSVGAGPGTWWALGADGEPEGLLARALAQAPEVPVWQAGVTAPVSFAQAAVSAPLAAWIAGVAALAPSWSDASPPRGEDRPLQRWMALWAGGLRD